CPGGFARALGGAQPIALAQPLEGGVEAVGVLDAGGDPAVPADVLRLRGERERQCDLTLLLRQLHGHGHRRAVVQDGEHAAAPADFEDVRFRPEGVILAGVRERQGEVADRGCVSAGLHRPRQVAGGGGTAGCPVGSRIASRRNRSASRTSALGSSIPRKVKSDSGASVPAVSQSTSPMPRMRWKRVWVRLTFWTRSMWVVRSRLVAIPVRIWMRRSVT